MQPWSEGSTTLRCFVAEQPVDPRSVGPPAMNYGQHWRWSGVPRYPYRYEMSTAEFLEAAGAWFEECRRELKEDQDVGPPGEFPDLDEFSAAGFPSLAELLDQNSDLLARLICRFALDVNNLFGGVGGIGVGRKVHYSTNSLDWFMADPSGVSFGGIAYELRSG